MNIKLYFQEKGAGEPFVFLHGNGENGTYFEKQMDFFSDKYKTITIDTRGHGKTLRGTAPFTIEQFALDLNNFMIESNIDNAIILGFSDGANIAMKFAIMFPKKVKALILNGGNINTKGVKKTTQIPIEIGYKIAKMFAKKSDGAKHNMEILGLMANNPNIEISELNNINVPTLVIAGTNDVIKKEHTKAIAKSIKNSKLVFLKGNHFIASKKSKEFNESVQIFLNENFL